MSAQPDSPDGAANFRRELVKQPNCRKLLSDLREDGCSEETLISLLLNASRAANAKPVKLFDAGGLSTTQLSRLKRNLISVAALVDRVNKTAISPKFDLKWAPPDKDRDPLREAAGRLYEMLPGIMEAYAGQLEQFVSLNRTILRRLTFTHYYALKLLQYLHQETGRPRYEDAADLLSGGFVALAGGEADLPEIFNDDALSKLYQRATALDKKPPNTK